MHRNSKINTLKTCLLSGFTAVLLLSPAAAQQEDPLQKSMTLVKPYQPSVSDVRREGTAPVVSDTVHLVPVFEYQFKPQQDRFALNARMASPELPDEADTLGINRGYISSGAGNYLNREMTAGYRAIPNDLFDYGIDFNHFSSSGKTRLLNKVRVPSKQSDNRLNAFGSYNTRHLRLDARVNLARRVTHAFGYNVLTLPDTVLKNNRHRYLKADAEAGIRSRTGAFNHDFNYRFGYQGIKDNFRFRENRTFVSGTITKGSISLTAGLDHVNRSNSFDTLRSVVVVGTEARYVREIGWTTVTFGAPLHWIKEQGLSTKWRFWPELEIIYRGWISASPYVGVRGGVQLLTYHDLLEENPFLVSGTMSSHSYIPFDLYAGIQGQKLGGRMRYSAELSLQRQKHAPFFVNHNDGVENLFDVVTDNISHFSARGEFSYRILPSLRLEATGAYHAYHTKYQDEAWHKPAYTASASLEYHLLRDWTVKVFTDLIGARYGLMHINGRPVTRKMDNVSLYGAEVTYHLLYNIDIYVKMHNLTAEQYERWMFYPSQKINYFIGSHYYFK